MTISTTRFYKPTLAKLTDAERAFGSQTFHRNSAEFDFLASGLKHSMVNRRVAMQYLNDSNSPDDFRSEFLGMGPFQIMYNFPSSIRNNVFSGGTYGSPGWSHRMLYEFLCEAFNAGVPFIDTYFGRVFKSRPVYREFLDMYNEVQDKLNNEQLDLFQGVPLKADGTPDMRYAASKRFMDFKVWQDPIIRQECKYIASEIRNDIVRCLYAGKIPVSGRMSPVVSKATQKQRERLLGMRHPNRLFFASGELIRHLNIYVAVARDKNSRGRVAA